MFLKRQRYVNAVREALSRSPIVAILGPRQCGKTTLSHHLGLKEKVTFFDLESPGDTQRLQNPEMTLKSLDGIVVLDEIQLKPEILSVLRVLVDRQENNNKYIILGSASPEIIKGASESLAGRVEFIDLHGFDCSEIKHEDYQVLWNRGGFPLSFIAKTEKNSLAWREGFTRTFLERDLPQLGINLPAPTLRRFWTMLAHSHGQIWNASKLAASMSLNYKTIQSYLDILTSTYMVRQLQPWYENLKKRQVKAPKVYLRDSGILHYLLSIPGYQELSGHPVYGASWEGFALEQVIRITKSHETYFWSTHSGAELDLLLFRHGKRIGFEFKLSEVPKLTKSMKVVQIDLSLDHLYIISPVSEPYFIQKDISVCAPWHVEELL